MTARRRSIVGDLSAALVIAVVVVGGVVFLLSLQYAEVRSKADEKQISNTLISTLTAVLAKPLWDFDDRLVQVIGQTYVARDDLEALIVERENGEVVFSAGRLPSLQSRVHGADIQFRDRSVGRVSFAVFLEHRRAVQRDFQIIFLITISVLLLAVLIVSRLAMRYFLKRPLKLFSANVKAFSQGDDSEFLFEEGYDEFDDFSDVLVAMKKAIAYHIYTLEETVKERTRELNKAKERAENYLDIAGTMIVSMDVNGNVALINNKGCEVLGYDQGDILGHNWFDTVIPAECREQVKDVFSDVISGNVSLYEIYENEVLTRTGERRQIVWHNSFSREPNGTITGTLSAGVDITETRNMQAQLIQSSKLATLGEMATGVAHELNQPMNVILMAANNIQRKIKHNQLDNEYAAAKLDKIVSQVNRATTIIDHMRVFGRKPADDPEILSPISIVTSALELISEQLRLSSIQVETDFQDTTSVVMGHQIQLEQVLLNLISNARDALKECPDTEKRITVRVASDAGDKTVRIEVEDTGGGIPDDQKSRIFEPFYTTKEVGQGTGLGLSISYGIVKDMGGVLSVTNKPLGACFTISLPGEHQTS